MRRPLEEAQCDDARLGKRLAAVERLGRDGDGLDAPLCVGLLALRVQDVERELVLGDRELVLEDVKVLLRAGEERVSARSLGRLQVLRESVRERRTFHGQNSVKTMTLPLGWTSFLDSTARTTMSRAGSHALWR